MAHYRGNVRDLEFNLFEVFGVTLSGDADEQSARDLLRALDTLAAGPLAASFVDGDREPPAFDRDTHAVRTHPGLKAGYRLLRDGDWHRLALPVELGGFGFPPSVQWAAAEILLTANPALYMYFSSVPNAAAILHRTGTAEQRRWAGFMVERDWAATMVITEPEAGSDVGAARTRAIRQDDGSWLVEGVKRFITGGEHDLTENIMHLVLARPEGDGVTTRPGTKGLSLFLVPKFHFDPATGEPGERNGVFATALEEKMGLRASATCELAFGAHGTPARGWLLGDVHDGIAQMFQAIEWARMTVGTKGIGTLSSAYRHAVEHARTRVQGPDLSRMLDKAAPRVPIIAHPDVRRSLLLQKAYCEGLRGVYLYAAGFQDQALGGEAGAAAVNDLLLPVVKGVGSERTYEQLTAALQVLGGSGYLADHPIEQYIRDSKIDSLYEGTTAIQSMDFFFRKVVRDGGAALRVVAGEVEAFLGGGDERLKAERELLRKAADDVQAMVLRLTMHLLEAQSEAREMYKVGQHTVRLLMSFGDLLVGWLLLRQAEVALAALDRQPGPADEAFYTGKVAVASFFAKTVLPELSARRAVVEASDNALMDVPETAF